MKYLIILLCLTINFSLFGQVKTILAIPQDSTNINLRINEIKRLNTTSHLLFAAGVISTMVIYNIDNKSPFLFIIPLGFCVTGMGLHIYQSKLEADLE